MWITSLLSHHRTRAQSSRTSPDGEKQQHEGSRAAARTLSKSTGKKFDQSNITKCCKGNATHHHGYTFCYASDEEESDSEEATAAPKKEAENVLKKIS